MSIYVLVHGGFYGGWGWAQVARFLRTERHEVFTPTLTGLGERAHLASPEIGLNTHIQDIVGVLECEELQEVILVGHSYGSMVITGVAERVPERLSRLVYVDTIIPRDGQSWNDLLGPEVAKLELDLANKDGNGWRVTLFDDPPRWQPHPYKTCIDPLAVKNPLAVPIPRAYIHTPIRRNEGWLDQFWPRVDYFAEEVKQKGWWYRSLPAGHDAMLSMPKEMAELLHELA
jgi:pimeloyl-ACP methyl ester carboxylesterase